MNQAPQPKPGGLLPGSSDFLWARWDGAAVRQDPEWAEATLTCSPTQLVFGQIGAEHGQLTPEDDQGTERLDQAMKTRSRIVLLSAVRDEDGHQVLGLTVYRYEQADPMDPQSIGVGDRVMTTAGSMWPQLRNRPDKILQWLSEQLLFPPRPSSGPDAPHRLVVSVGLADLESGSAGYRIHGRGLVADVRTERGRMVMSRLRRADRRTSPAPLRLTECRVRFTDVSQASVIQAAMRHQLGRLATGQGFLAMWNDYNRLETQFIRREVRAFGEGAYRSAEHIGNGVHRFHVEGHRGEDGLTFTERARRVLDRRETLELEISGRRPDLLAEDIGDESGWALIDEVLAKDIVIGELVDAATVAGTVDVHMIGLGRAGVPGVGADRSLDVPAAGFLYRAFRGDRRQMQRRKAAFDRVLSGGTAIRNLLPLLEGQTIAAAPIHPVKAMSEAARACFNGGEPTPQQEEALRVALNTPDIALIQGPPGTGKTQVIAALQTRLAEEGREYARLKGSILLTSFQHAAVEEMVERSTVYGLPAHKVDRARRGTTVRVDQWREDTIDAVGGQIETGSLGEALAVLRQVTARTAGYLLAPTPPNDTARLLAELDELAGGRLPAELADRLRTKRWALSAARLVVAGEGDEARELAARALRTVRTAPESFLDDGPRTASKALRRSRPYAADTPEDLAILERAAEWADLDQAPPFLTELAAARDRLLDRLLPETAPPPAAADPEVAELLEEITEAIEDEVRGSEGDGSELAVLDYLESLRGDPEAVDWTLRAYTASYAATCQQAASPAVQNLKEETRIEDVVFDTVIIDEAARANPLDLMIPLIQAGKRAILVGDHKQLPHMLEPDLEQQIESSNPTTRGLLRESLFQRLFTGLDLPDPEVRRTVTLDAQFRMHPVLGRFVSHTFYGKALRSPRPAADFEHMLPGYEGVAAAWIEVPAERGTETGGRSKRRPAEAKALVDELVRLEASGPDLTFGVISFYSRQEEEIWEQLALRNLARRTDGEYTPAERLQYDRKGKRVDRLRVGSVDAFQGKEFDVVLLSATRSVRHPSPPEAGTPAHDTWVRRTYGHLTLVNRLCVAMSRQKRLLVVVGDPEMFTPPAAPPQIAPLTDFYRLCGGEHGRVISA